MLYICQIRMIMMLKKQKGQYILEPGVKADVIKVYNKMCAVFLCVCRDTDCLLDPEADKENDIY